MTRPTMTCFVLCTLMLAATGCTVVKPVTCAVVHPVRSFIHLWNEAGDTDDDDEYKEMPTALALVEGVIVLPLFWAYKTSVGAVGGLFTGVVSDLNLITGHADMDSTLETLTNPVYTNALPPD